MTSTEIAVADLSSLELVDPANRELAVTQYLTHARDQLALAVQFTGPEDVAAIKAEIATAAEATKQLGLSKEIQTDAQEMVRRANYAVARAVRQAQNAGTVRREHETAYRPIRESDDPPDQGMVTKASPMDFFQSKNEATESYALADGVSEDEFEAALSEARAEGNLSRANVVRKIKGEDPKPSARNELMRGMRRIDPNRVIRETVIALEGTRVALDLLEPHHYLELDESEIDWWRKSLTASVRALNKLRKELDHG